MRARVRAAYAVSLLCVVAATEIGRVHFSRYVKYGVVYTAPHLVAVAVVAAAAAHAPVTGYAAAELVVLGAAYGYAAWRLVDGGWDIQLQGRGVVFPDLVELGVMSSDEVLAAPPYVPPARPSNDQEATVQYIKSAGCDSLSQNQCGSCMITTLAYVIRYHHWRQRPVFPDVDDLLLAYEQAAAASGYYYPTEYPVNRVPHVPVCTYGVPIDFVAMADSRLFSFLTQGSSPLVVGTTNADGEGEKYWCTTRNASARKRHHGCNGVNAFWRTKDGAAGLDQLRNEMNVERTPTDSSQPRPTYTINGYLARSPLLNSMSAGDIRSILTHGPAIVTINADSLLEVEPPVSAGDCAQQQHPYVYSSDPVGKPNHAVLLYDLKDADDGGFEYVLKNPWGVCMTGAAPGDEAPCAYRPKYLYFNVKKGTNGLGLEQDGAGGHGRVWFLHDQTTVELEMPTPTPTPKSTPKSTTTPSTPSPKSTPTPPKSPPPKSPPPKSPPPKSTPTPPTPSTPPTPTPTPPTPPTPLPPPSSPPSKHEQIAKVAVAAGIGAGLVLLGLYNWKTMPG